MEPRGAPAYEEALQHARVVRQPNPFDSTTSLPAKFDAVLYIETTQPTALLRPGAH